MIIYAARNWCVLALGGLGAIVLGVLVELFPGGGALALALCLRDWQGGLPA